MTKIVINSCFGGFSLSEAAYKELGMQWDGYGYDFNKDRTNPKLIAAVEKLGEKANGHCANLIIVEIPDDVEWQIEAYDGYEHIAEKHRTWH